MQRILHMVGSLGYAGLEASVMNLYRHIDRERFQFDFVVCSSEKQRYDNEIEAMGGRIFRLPSRSRSPYLYYKNLRKLFNDNPEYKIFHVHSNSAGLFVDCLAAKKSGVPIIIAHSHNSSCIRKLQHHFFKPFLPYVINERFACSSDAGKWLFGNDSFNVINNGIELEKYQFDNEVRVYKRKSLEVSDELVIGHVGSFNGVKNQKFIIDLVRELNLQGINTKCFFVGDGKLKSESIEYADNLDVLNYVKFLGNRDDISELLSAVDFFCFPSLFEGLGIALIEAQVAGLKCLSSNKVPSEAKITENVCFLPIDQGVEVWAEHIKMNIGYKREKTINSLEDSVWSVKNTVKNLTDFYEKKQMSLLSSQK